jgi:cytochrome c553
MRGLNKTILLAGTLMMINAGLAAGAGLGTGQSEVGNSCFKETVKVANGVDPDSLSTIHCSRALKAKLLSRENQSAMLFNRGIIQKAQGDLVAARTSFEKALRLSETVDKRNLALAEVARELGDHRVALEQYDLLAQASFGVDSDNVRTALLARRQMVDAAYFASMQNAQACEGCHGANGVSANPAYPTLAGRQGDYLEHALRQYKQGERHHAVMSAQATLIVDDDIPLLANYFASFDGR